MTTSPSRMHVVATALCVGAGLIFVACVWQPVARTGMGSVLSIHELFDLLLAGRIPVEIPRWIGMFGYLPAIGGAVMLMAEAFHPGPRSIVRGIGYILASVSILVLVTQGPWSDIGLLGRGSWMGLVAIVVGGMGVVLATISAPSTRSPLPPATATATNAAKQNKTSSN